MNFLVDNQTGAQSEGESPEEKVYAGKLYLAASATTAVGVLTVKYRPTANQPWTDLATINSAGVTVVDVASGIIVATASAAADGAYLGVEQ